MSPRAAVQARLRELAGGLLRGRRVDVFLGFRKSGIPFRARPVAFHDAEDTESLVWNSFCSHSLAAYLRDWFPVGGAAGAAATVRVGLAVKPCDARAALRLVAEGVVPRDGLFLIGIRCSGMLDRRRAEAALGRREALGAGENDGGDIRVVVDDGSEVTLPRSPLLHRVCRECREREPQGCEVVLDGADGPVDEAPAGRGPAAALSEEEVRRRVAAELARCLGCGACRSVCPLFDEEAWTGCGPVEDRAGLHAERFHHLAGRCTSCGACDRACPAGVDTLFLVRPTPAGRCPVEPAAGRNGAPSAPGGPSP
ncbi:MAG: 4Fe-4S dicluster domain-containing protein [Deltaproteobacteria bacterium]|nr:4Fe-4S dicluster domain-containing protein [Deltaproteobacteria bacterium]